MKAKCFTSIGKSTNVDCEVTDSGMSKGNNQRGNKEAKKPKQEKAKVTATANTMAAKPALSIAGKKVK